MSARLKTLPRTRSLQGKITVRTTKNPPPKNCPTRQRAAEGRIQNTKKKGTPAWVKTKPATRNHGRQRTKKRKQSLLEESNPVEFFKSSRVLQASRVLQPSRVSNPAEFFESTSPALGHRQLPYHSWIANFIVSQLPALLAPTAAPTPRIGPYRATEIQSGPQTSTRPPVAQCKIAPNSPN